MKRTKSTSTSKRRTSAGTTNAGRPARVKILNAGYDVVSAALEDQRREVTVELQGEDGILSTNKRLRLTALMRDMMRNSPLRVHIDQQQRVNVVGAVGGKLYAAFPEGAEKSAQEVMHYFNQVFFPRAEFTFGNNFNWLLKTCLTSMDDGGNVVLVFDDGILTGGKGTGRIRAFEGDEIADCVEFKNYFSSGFHQSQGFVYNPAGMFCGAFLSTSQRGRCEFRAQDGLLCLRRDPYAEDEVCNWSVLGDMRRFNQGRAISPLASALATMLDANEANTNERLSTKYNAQLFAKLVEKEASGGGGSRGAFSGTGEDGDPVVEIDAAPLRRNGIAFQQVPYGMDLEMMDLRHPNDAMDAFLERLAGNAAGTKGLARLYATGRVQTSYTAFRGEQLMSWQSFKEAQKDLERNVCDWAARNVISRAVRLGYISSPLPDGWETMISWSWPHMQEVSEKDAAAGLNQRIKNGTTSLRREVNPGEVERIIAEQAAEKELFTKAGLIYPSTESVSGMIAPEGGENKEETQE